MTKKEPKDDGVAAPSGKQKTSALTISQINADKLTLVGINTNDITSTPCPAIIRLKLILNYFTNIK